MLTTLKAYPGVVAVLGICSALVLAGCEYDSATPMPQPTVEVYDVRPAQVNSERIFHGRVVPADLTRVSFRIRGTIDYLGVQAGEKVSQGQVLARVDDSIQRQVLADAKARYRLSERQLQRADKLHSRGSLTSSERDKLQAEFRLAEANFRLAKASLTYTAATSPFDGIVAEVNKELHEAVKVGESIVTVYRSDRVDVMVNIADTLPAKMHKVQNIADIESRAVFAGGAEVYTMNYLKSSSARNPKTQAFQFWFTMPTAASQLPPGLPVTMTADFHEGVSRADSGVLVPLTALEPGEREDIFRVWRYQNGTVEPTFVRVERVTQEGALIRGDVQPGDQVVIRGLFRLSPGQKVINKQIKIRGSKTP